MRPIPRPTLGTVAGLVFVVAAVSFGAWTTLASCSMVGVEAVEEGEPVAEERCVERYDAAPFVLLSFMLAAGAGILLARPAIAWGGAFLALAGCLILGLSWGGVLLFHALAVALGVLLWYVDARRQGKVGRPLAATTWAVILSLPIGILAAVNLYDGVQALSDPCVQWGPSNSISMSPDDPCQAKTSYGVTKAEYTRELVLQHAAAFLAVGLAVVGAWRRLPWLLLAAAFLWLVVTGVLLMGFGYPLVPLTLAAGIACAYAGWPTEKRGEGAPGKPGEPEAPAPAP
jgi:hypothetical protein